MTFGEAVKHAQEGELIQREGWNGKGMHVYLEDAQTTTIGDGVFKGQKRIYEPYWVLYTAKGTHQPGWNASTPDTLADDWQLVSSYGANQMDKRAKP